MNDRHRPLRELLPVAARARRCPDQLWGLAIDPGTPEGVKALYFLIVCEENQAQVDGGLDGLVATAYGLRTDLLAHRNDLKSPISTEDLSLLMFATTLGPAMLAVLQRQASIAYDWLRWSLADTWDVDGEVDAARIHSAAVSLLPEAVPDVIVPWLTALYRYDWQTGGLAELAVAIAPTATSLATEMSFDEDSLEMVEALLSWAGTGRIPADDPTFGRLSAISDRLRELAETPDGEIELARKALRVLATCAESVTGEDVRQRSRELLDRYPDDLSATERLEALGNALAGDGHTIARRIDEFIQLVGQQHTDISARGRGQASYAWARGGMFTLIQPPLVALLRDGEVRAATRLLAAWQGIPGDERLALAPLIALHDREEGLSWVCDGASAYASPTGVSHRDYFMAANAALGTTVVNRLGGATDLAVPDRGRGVPSPPAAPAFEALATDFLSLADAQAAFDTAADYGDPPLSMVVLPTQQAPVQPLMLKELGWTLPLSTSLRASSPDRPIRRATVWIGGSYSAQMEREAVLDSLRAAAIDFVIRDEDEMSGDLFAADYLSEEFDLIWVGTHGIYDALTPEGAHLLLPNGDRIMAADLAYDHASTNVRRLLVLNACDSGTTALLGGYGEIGLGSAAAGPGQAVVCHLWPVASMTVAPAFAAMLLCTLSDTDDYFGAYARTVRAFAAGPNGVHAELNGRADRIIRIVESHPEDFENLLGWASAAFFE